MALKTFNLDQQVYEEFSKHCKNNGISMSKKIENFIREEVSKISNFGELKLDIEKNVKENPGLGKNSSDKSEHPMGKYC